MNLLNISIFSYDFNYFYAASELLRQGLNPFDSTLISNSLQDYFLYTGKQSFNSVPWIVFWLWPMSYIGYNTSFILFEALSLFALLESAYILKDLFSNYLKNLSVISIFITSIFFPPVLKCILDGQISILVLFFFLQSIAFYKQKKYFFAGLLFGVLSLKPQIFAPFLIVLFFLSFNATKKILLGCFASILLQIIGSFILLNNPIDSYATCFQQSNNFMSKVIFPNFSFLVFDLVRDYISYTYLSQLLYIFSFILTFFLIKSFKKNDKTFIQNILLIIPASCCLFSPYIWLHDFSYMLPIYILFLSKFSQQLNRFTPIFISFIFGTTFLLVFLYELTSDYNFLSLYLLLFLYGLLLYSRQENTNKLS